MSRFDVPLAGAAAAALLTVAGCSTQPVAAPTKTVVITRTAVPSQTPSASPSQSPSASASPTTTAARQLPGTCDGLLPAAAVDNALGHTVGGKTAFVVGLPEKDIGRIGYINCRYGLPAGAQAKTAIPKVEIGVSLYRSADLAAKRIPATVDAYTAHGAKSTTTKVNGVSADVLTGGTAAGYRMPTLVLASGQRTVAVTVDERAGASATKDLVALAKLALSHTAD